MPNKKTNKPERELPPTILTIFGSTGDLTADYLMPALMHMDEKKLLPKDFKLVCVGRRQMTTEAYFNFIIKKSVVITCVKPEVKKQFLKRLSYYVGGDFTDVESFKGLAELLSDTEKSKHKCYNRLYYVATSPQYFSAIASLLKSSGLLMACADHQRQARVLIEKPFGFNLETAKTLNNTLLKYFTEQQIYRIDHYQGKETVQNLMVVRFANSIFEPLWNNRHIDHIEISVLEKDGVGERAAYYDEAGTLKDMMQNHILQMLALITMDEPKDLTADYIRDEKLKILKALQLVDAPASMVRGQYASYDKEVGRVSKTETFLALKVLINSKRWKDVPIYLRTGKNLSKKVAEISVHFKEPSRCIFRGCASNILTFRIQPDESVHLRLNNKVPGFGIDLQQGDYEFGYEKAFMTEIPAAYERLLLDFIEGDQRLFIRSDEIEAAWKFIDIISHDLSAQPLYTYKPGTNGPKESDNMIKKDNREWKTE